MLLSMICVSIETSLPRNLLTEQPTVTEVVSAMEMATEKSLARNETRSWGRSDNCSGLLATAIDYERHMMTSVNGSCT